MICDTGKDCLPQMKEESFADGSACVVDFSKTLMDVARRESCGKCVLCREGTWQVYEIIKDVTEGKAETEDFELLKELLEKIEGNAGCEMSVAAASLCLGLLSNYQAEWDQHIRRKRCTNLICKSSFTLYIAPELCNGCGKCIEECPRDAISGGKDMIHVVSEECDKCMKCVSICPLGAIKKAGPVKPKVPAEPVPVGSFGEASGDESGSGMRRRRRGE